MSDREKAPTMSGEYDSLNLWNDGNATLLVRNVFETTFFINPTPASDKVDVTARIKRKYLPSLLSGLTLEDVERAIEETRTEVGSWENAQCRVGAFVALDDLVRRLRQQVNGDTCNREEGRSDA